ncbi:DUF3267 domain-containing protein [bacterium D16-50]|nr:DUF3267 domain-containing protein [bacterium D16-50]
MAHIKWVGIIKGEIADYQKGYLDSKAKQMELPATLKEMMTKALPFALAPFAIIFLSIFIKTSLAGETVIEPIFFVGGFVAGFIGLFAHEWLHAIVYPLNAAVYIGFHPKSFAAVALVSYPLKKWRFILMSLLPLLLGIVPIALFWLTPIEWKDWGGFWFGLSIMGLISPYPDCYNVYQVVKQTPPKCRIQNYGDDTYWIE